MFDTEEINKTQIICEDFFYIDNWFQLSSLARKKISLLWAALKALSKNHPFTRELGI